MTNSLPIFQDGVSKERLTRQSPYSYTCNRCNRCCQHQRIRINPYEVARLALSCGISTTEFISQFTTENGIEILRQPDGRCVLLTEQGCGVHADRPLVCRIYPLGRHRSPTGEEHFIHVRPHPETQGVYGKEGTVADFLEAQGAEIFLSTLDRYIAFLEELSHILESNHQIHKNRDILEEWSLVAIPGSPALQLLDMDLAVKEYCDLHSIPIPIDVDEKLTIHLQYLEDLRKNLEVLSKSNR